MFRGWSRSKGMMAMAEYIEREAAIKAQCVDCGNYGFCDNDCSAIESIKRVPAADVRPVVLCRDCKYWELSKIEPSFRVCTYVCGATFVRKAEDFCSRGEKREES